MNLDNHKKADLIVMIEQLSTEDKNKSIAELQEIIAKNEGMIADLEKKVSDLEAAASESELSPAEKSEYENVIAGQAKRIRALELTKGNPHPMMSVGGKQIQLKGSIRIKGKVYTPADLENNPDLVAAEVAKGNKMFPVVGESNN